MIPEVKNIIEKVDSIKADIERYKPFDTEMERRLIQKLRLDWNYHSSNIEGNTLTYGETKALLNCGITASGKPLLDHIQMS